MFVGTSGWYYDWNEEKTLDWYVCNSGLNAIELNASFYRFPFPNQVKSWARKGHSLRWVIKVNRLITHRLRFSEKAHEVWRRFYGQFSVMSELIDFFLFQLPPIVTEKARDRIAGFIEKTKIVEKCALEPRHDSWFNSKVISWAKSIGMTWVSIDAPEFTKDIIKTKDSVYLRMHGRTAWYSHNYKTNELKAISKHILAAEPERVYVFFNNDHNMLINAQSFRDIIGRLKV